MARTRSWSSADDLVDRRLNVLLPQNRHDGSFLDYVGHLSVIQLFGCWARLEKTHHSFQRPYF
jgi:hypothetical protein